MTNTQPIFAKIAAKYDRRTPLSLDARTALLALPHEIKVYSRHQYLVREGERVKTAKLIVDGLAYRHKVTAEGTRQILSIQMAGDFIGLEGSLLNLADHHVQVLESCTVAEVPRTAVVDLIGRHGSLAHAMWIDTLIDASVNREWVVNVGRRDARQALCHLLCEFGRRLELAGVANGTHFQLPMTQEQLADCLGITPVHVNRILKELDKEGLIIKSARSIEVPVRSRLHKIAGFSDLYLHLDLLAA